MSPHDSIMLRYDKAIRQSQIPNSMVLPNSHFVSNLLPGSTSSSTKVLKNIQQMYTPAEFSNVTQQFKGRLLNSRTGLPNGRGAKMVKVKKKRRKKRQSKSKEQLQMDVSRIITQMGRLDAKSRLAKAKNIKRIKRRRKKT